MDKGKYLKAISKSASGSSGTGPPLIFYTNGLIIVALLLLILCCRIWENRRREKQKNKFALGRATMPERTKKRPAEIELHFKGPASNRSKAVKAMKDLGFN